MIDLRETLQELAEAAARHGGTPGPAAAIRRGRQRRRRIAGVAAALVVALAIGTGATGRLAGRLDLLPTSPATTLPPLPRLDLRAETPAPPAVSAAVQTLDRGIRRCPGGTTKAGNLIGYFRSPEFRRLVVIAGKPPSAGQTRICWAMGVFDPDGSGKLFRPVKPVPIATPLTANVEGLGGHGTIYGQADARTGRVQVRFRDRPTLDLAAIHGSYVYEVNFYVGLFPPGWVPVEVTTFDAQGRRLAGCAIDPSVSTLPRCPGN